MCIPRREKSQPTRKSEQKGEGRGGEVERVVAASASTRTPMGPAQYSRASPSFGLASSSATTTPSVQPPPPRRWSNLSSFLLFLRNHEHHAKTGGSGSARLLLFFALACFSLHMFYYPLLLFIITSWSFLRSLLMMRPHLHTRGIVTLPSGGPLPSPLP